MRGLASRTVLYLLVATSSACNGGAGEAGGAAEVTPAEVTSAPPSPPASHGHAHWPPPRPQRAFSALPDFEGQNTDEYEFLLVPGEVPRVVEIEQLSAEGRPYESSCEYSVFFRHPEFEGGRFMMFMPENLWVNDGSGGAAEFIYPTSRTDPRWVVDERSMSYAESFAGTFAEKSTETEIGVDFGLKVVGRDDTGLDLTLTVRNTGRVALSYVQSVFCLHTDAPQAMVQRLHADHGATNWVHRGDAGWSPFESEKLGPGPKERPDFLLRPGRGLVVRQEKDQRWAMALAWDDVLTLESVGPQCIHANPRVTDLQPGAEAQRRGKVYLMAGGKEAILDRFCADFGCD